MRFIMHNARFKPMIFQKKSPKISFVKYAENKKNVLFKINLKTLELVSLISYKLKTEVIGSLEKTSVKNECCEG